ncbi:para-nitrobenzyl esterase [Saccharopolyspora erythraea NRRL 2338]|uniref:Carboxylic ester hydrolase n=2 Tax=Saccharopolyspora erythraea TaxID=1836 RepID=A4FFV6_SACEN|nr:carboxylesterase family protein [Saccharopolyspora erythraea]EQD81841.1 carboxylesterase [Saccharopolyspora erythraea D]PFG96638.1 para-nitrobenzyl esterase [Saccharopolyspora erythraea NRRL 2338]QRK93119.1 carboxylesterase family protein [Saccharopolyspora erythraea]CAM02931.1 carboxylesterase [Saccharopolyspora erythraea NRRL 2338]
MDLETIIESGRVRGRPVAGATAFLGIPYAAPPFGPRRFLPPRPPRSWSGVRDCHRFGPIAPQSARLPGAPVWSPQDEDVLTLNVWTPHAAERLPVLVWIHGGAYSFGSSAQPDFDGAALARAGLVVVTCNFRLGFEGFGRLEDFPDNRGLLDQAAALRWVRDNIAGFGGDPAAVTVAGQSSGAGSIVCLMDLAAGLFRRAILHSVPDAYCSSDFATAIAQEVAAQSGVAPDLASPRQLVAASDQVAASSLGSAPGRRGYDPVLYGPVLDHDPRPDPAVELLICHTTREYWLFDEVGGLARVQDDDGLADFARALDIPASVLTGYRDAMPGATVHELHLALFGDRIFGAHSTRLALRHADAGGRTHLARFARQRHRPDGSAVHPWHCADVPFCFGNIESPEAEFLIGGPPDDADHALSQRMVRAWADFAATGDPGWRPLGTPARPVRVWDVEDADPQHVQAPPLDHWFR